MQNDALIPRPAHQPGWGLDAERGGNRGGQEEDLENRRLFHIRSGRSRSEHTTLELLNSMRKHKPKSSPKKRIQTAKYAEYAEKWNTSAYFAYSAVLSPFYFGDVFAPKAFVATFCAVLSGAAALRRGFGIKQVDNPAWYGIVQPIPRVNKRHDQKHVGV